MHDTPNVHLSLPSRPENVLLVRQALSGLAARVGLDAIETNDLNTAVTEACNNVVMHAYEGAEGPLDVEVRLLEGAIGVSVRDCGVGIGADPRERTGSNAEDDQHELDGMGLAVIEALARRVELAEPAGGGTDVRMEFPLPDGVALESIDGTSTNTSLPEMAPAGAVELRIAPSALAQAILPRVLSALAARAHFTTDRIADVQLVADALATNAGESLEGASMAVAVTVAPRSLELRIGPLHAGRGESLVETAADGLAPVVERLTDSTRVAPSTGAGETLELRLVDRR
ncbi:MAG TPA: ATP-binding protein [Solirubrobacteraceae bacterium]|jgi:serine/threonine-protein kinase RsbW|nr:ATP-binding protein [Solirubrobacteraceae bacterium]